MTTPNNKRVIRNLMLEWMRAMQHEQALPCAVFAVRQSENGPIPYLFTHGELRPTEMVVFLREIAKQLEDGTAQPMSAPAADWQGGDSPARK